MRSGFELRHDPAWSAMSQGDRQAPYPPSAPPTQRQPHARLVEVHALSVEKIKGKSGILHAVPAEVYPMGCPRGDRKTGEEQAASETHIVLSPYLSEVTIKCRMQDK